MGTHGIASRCSHTLAIHSIPLVVCSSAGIGCAPATTRTCNSQTTFTKLKPPRCGNARHAGRSVRSTKQGELTSIDLLL